MDGNGVSPPCPAGSPQEFVSSPIADSFLQLLGESLQELYSKLFVEYQRTKQVGSAAHALSDVGGQNHSSKEAPRYSLLSVDIGSPKSRTSCIQKQQGQPSSPFGASYASCRQAQPQRTSIVQQQERTSIVRFQEAPPMLDMADSCRQAQQERTSIVQQQERASIVRFQEAPTVMDHETSENADGLEDRPETPKRFSLVPIAPTLSVTDPSGQQRTSMVGIASKTTTSPRVTIEAANSAVTEREVYDVHAIYKKRAESTKVEKRSINPTPTMQTMDLEEMFSGVDFLDQSCFDDFDYCVCSPTSKFRIMWEIIGAILVLYDLIEIPVELSFKPKETTLTSVMAWLQRLYWTIDCVSLFGVGYTTSKGTLVMKARLIVKHYVRTWFPLDIFVCFCDWFDYVSDQVGVFSVLQGIRVLRLIKLLRACHIAAHMPQVVDSMFASKAHSEGAKLVGSTLRMMACAAMLLHLIACAWHAIGKHSLPHGSGWLFNHIYTPSTGNGVVDTSATHSYLVSYHWSITQLIGSADIYPHGSWERFFAILVLFLAFVISASVVSSITTSMTAIQFIASQKKKQLDRLQKYLVVHKIPSAIAARVLQNAMFAQEETNRNVQESEVELLQMISEPLYVELHHAMYKDYLEWHPFFAYYMEKNQQALRQICHVSLSQANITRGDVLFSHSEQKGQPQMYFLLTGKMLYLKPQCSPCYLKEGDFASEHCLWTTWSHQGGLRATEPCSILCLDAERFLLTANQFQSAAFWPAVYAQGFVSLLNDLDTSDLTDLNDRWALDVYSLAKSIFVGEEEAIPAPSDWSGSQSRRSSIWSSWKSDIEHLFGIHHSAKAQVAKNAARASAIHRSSQGPSDVDAARMAQLKSAQRAAAIGAEAAAEIRKWDNKSERTSASGSSRTSKMSIRSLKSWISNASRRSGRSHASVGDSSVLDDSDKAHSGALPRVTERASQEFRPSSQIAPLTGSESSLSFPSSVASDSPGVSLARSVS